MPKPMDASAAELAEMLDDMILFPHNTAGLSMLDEATTAFAHKFPALGDAQQEFATARYRHKQAQPGPEQDTAWAEAMTAAQSLARLLRPLGDAHIDNQAT